MDRFKELEELYERYNYKKMSKHELYQLVQTLLTDMEALIHFYWYEVARGVWIRPNNFQKTPPLH